MIRCSRSVAALACTVLLSGCNSDEPVSAVTDVIPPGFRVTVTRVATHPFLARYNLTLLVGTPEGCSTSSELFPDTGGVSRRNLYRATRDRLYLVGQFDVRRFHAPSCRIELVEFRSLEPNLIFIGSFDVGRSGRWTFSPAESRAERPFEPL
jgi:hypothetical protein